MDQCHRAVPSGIQELAVSPDRSGTLCVLCLYQRCFGLLRRGGFLVRGTGECGWEWSRSLASR